MTTTKTFTIACTDKGSHGRITLREFVVAADGSLDEQRSHHAVTPWGQGAELTAPAKDGTATTHPAPLTYIDLAPSARERKPGEWDKWRFICPKCGRDKPLALATLEKIVRAYLDEGLRVLDISRLPTG